MASSMAFKMPFSPLRQQLPVSTIARRSLTTLPSTRISSKLTARNTPSIPRSALQLSFKRCYADAPSVNLSPQPKRRRFRVLRWVWRFTYISALAGTGYLTWQIWALRHPADQFEPDPSKKTLVILGKIPYKANITIC